MAEEKATEEEEKVVVARAVAGHAAAHGGGWARGAFGVAFWAEVEWTVVAWAGTAMVAVTRIEAASGQSPEGTGTAWVGASNGEARAAREARAEAVALGSTAKQFAGTKGLQRGCCLQRKGWSGWGRRQPGPAAHDGDWAHAGLRVSRQQGGRSFRRRPRPLCPRGQAGEADTCHTRSGKWSVQWNRKRKQRAVL
jgi:hypothetical protein